MSPIASSGGQHSLFYVSFSTGGNADWGCEPHSFLYVHTHCCSLQTSHRFQPLIVVFTLVFIVDIRAPTSSPLHFTRFCLTLLPLYLIRSRPTSHCTQYAFARPHRPCIPYVLGPPQHHYIPCNVASPHCRCIPYTLSPPQHHWIPYTVAYPHHCCIPYALGIPS